MLKKRIKSLTLVTAILLNIAAVSVNAKHSVTSVEDVATNLLNESFNDMTFSSSGYKHYTTEAELTGTGLGIMQKWNTATIGKETEDTNSYLSQIVSSNGTTLYFNPSNTVQLQSGDKIKLTFDFRQKEAEAKFYIRLKGNSAATFTWVSGNSMPGGNYGGRIVSKAGYQIIPGSNTKGSDNLYKFGEWYTANIIIDTLDEEMENNAQSMKLELLDKEQNVIGTYSGTLDADGDSSNGITALTSFSGFEFVTEPRNYDENNAENCVPTKLDLDNIIIDHTTTEEISYPISYVKQNIINEDFESASLVAPYTRGYEKKIDGTENIITYTTSAWSHHTGISADILEDNEKGKVLILQCIKLQ